jgi:ferric-dicitrate binding protein FerR (iron transport regulator)
MPNESERTDRHEPSAQEHTDLRELTAQELDIIAGGTMFLVRRDATHGTTVTVVEGTVR